METDADDQLPPGDPRAGLSLSSRCRSVANASRLHSGRVLSKGTLPYSSPAFFSSCVEHGDPSFAVPPLYSHHGPLSDLTTTLVSSRVHTSAPQGAEPVLIQVSEGGRHVCPHTRPRRVFRKMPS